MKWDVRIIIYTTDTIYKKDNNNLLYDLYNTEGYLMFCSDPNGKETPKRGDMCICMVDSFLYMKLTQHCIAIQLQ